MIKSLIIFRPILGSIIPVTPTTLNFLMGASEAKGIVFFRVVGVTGMIGPKIGRKIVKDLIIKWDPEVDLRRLIYES